MVDEWQQLKKERKSLDVIFSEYYVAPHTEEQKLQEEEMKSLPLVHELK